MISLRHTLCLTSAFFLLSAGSALAQYAPVPKKSPRTPVTKQVLKGGKTSSLAPSHILSGLATVLDAERLRIQNIEVRLFGVVPPQMGASFGPQARAVVDALTQGSVTCQIKDRTRDGNYLALCNNEAGSDFGLELLRRGLATCARGSLRSTPYEAPYQAAEAAAQNQKLGLWSGSIPAAASESSIREVMAKTQIAKIEADKAKQEAKKAQNELEKAKAQLEQLESIATAAEIATQPMEPQDTTTADIPSPEPTTTTVLSLSTGKNIAAPLPPFKPDLAVNLLQPPTAQEVQAVLDAAKAPPLSADQGRLAAPQTFVERYQLILSALLLFGTAVTLSAAFAWNKARQKREDMRSIAAALHGELMAARSVCKARLVKMKQDGSAKAVAWPRIRILVFQAYIGKLGCLGAELSRQIASIYGMASDYAAYYAGSGAAQPETAKQRALETLIRHIEEVTPRLNQIEKEGRLPKAEKKSKQPLAIKAPEKKLSLSTHPKPPSTGGDDDTKATVQAQLTPPSSSTITAVFTQSKTEILAESGGLKKALRQAKRRAKPAVSTMLKHSKGKAASPGQLLRETLHVDQAAEAAKKAMASLNLKAPIIERLSKLKKVAVSHLPAPQTTSTARASHEPIDDFTIPDYADLTEEELEALLYAEEEMTLASPVGKWRQVG
ncbi:MAG: thermonuclease family protein [Bdellovibrionales bacterium]